MLTGDRWVPVSVCRQVARPEFGREVSLLAAGG